MVDTDVQAFYYYGQGYIIYKRIVIFFHLNYTLLINHGYYTT